MSTEAEVEIEMDVDEWMAYHRAAFARIDAFAAAALTGLIMRDTGRSLTYPDLTRYAFEIAEHMEERHRECVDTQVAELRESSEEEGDEDDELANLLEQSEL